MWEIFSKIGSFLLVVIVLGGIYLVFYAEKDIQQDVLDYSLNLLGEKLLTLVPEGPGKTKLNDLYNSFKRQAVEGEIEPDQIEHVTANILNVSNNENSLTPEQAEGVIQSAFFFSKPGIPPAASGLPKPKGPIELEKREALGKRIKTMLEFNESMQILMKKQAIKKHEMSGRIHYYVKNGLRIELDDSIKIKLKEFEKLGKEFHVLEKMEVLKWRQNLAKELDTKRKEIQFELDSSQKLLKDLKEEKTLETLKHLEILDSLALLKIIPMFDADSIRELVKKSLEIKSIEEEK